MYFPKRLSFQTVLKMRFFYVVNSPGHLPCKMIMTSAGQLPCRNIIHVVGQNDPAKIKDIVYTVLKNCEENKLTSVAFPALGTGLYKQTHHCYPL